MTELDRDIKRVKAETTRRINRIHREMQMKFGEKKKQANYTIKKPHHKANSRKARDRHDEQRVERTNRLSLFPLACTGKPIYPNAEAN